MAKIHQAIDTSLINGVGQLLSEAARLWPEHSAVAEPDGKRWRQVTFSELESSSQQLAQIMASYGVGQGKRIALLVPPGIRFVSLVFALFKTGATIILIDSGIGRKNMIRCLEKTRPDGLVGIPKAHVARWIFRKRFPNARLNFVVGRARWPGCHGLENSHPLNEESATLPTLLHGDDAAVIFTSGSTGPPKGVCYTQGTFITQATEIRDWFGIEPGGADISGFPLFALFNTAMGKTTVFPKMDFSRPANVDPQLFLDAVEQFNADQSFGSPALWNTVGRWAEKNNRRLTSIRRVMSAGAPVPTHVLRRVRSIIARDGEVYTPYGSTEALPVACNSASIVLGETAEKSEQGFGICVGSRFAKIDWRVIEISDEPITGMANAREVPLGEIGELIVCGPVVTRKYFDNGSANALAKIADGDKIWHRMGDVGRLDEHNRFWFCGRKSQRIQTTRETMFTIPCESIINTHPAIYRCALVGVGKPGAQISAIVAEPWPEHWPAGKLRQRRLVDELLELARRNTLTAEIRHVFLRRKLPVDIRHNSKIFRERLRDWAATQAVFMRN